MAAFWAILTCTSELDSAVQYSTPTVFALGSSFTRRSNCSSTGVRSEVPVTLLPGFLLLFTRPDAAKSVMAVPTMGMSDVAPATACAAGVAMARIRSSPSFTSFVAMVWQADWSFWAFCWSILYLRPDFLRAFTKPLFAASRASCSVSCRTPIL